jgi:hypothetical protein
MVIERTMARRVLPFQAGTAPDLVPGEARDQVLEVGVEVVGVVQRTLHPGVAKDTAAVVQAALEVVVDRIKAHGVVTYG